MKSTNGYDIATSTRFETLATVDGSIIVWLKNECCSGKFVVSGCRTHLGAVAKALRMVAK